MSWRPEAIAELVRLGRAGETWHAIGMAIVPQAGNPVKRCSMTWARYASAEDKRARRAALKLRGYNRPKEYRNHGLGGGIAGKHEPALKRESRDPWAGMGNCFA